MGSFDTDGYVSEAKIPHLDNFVFGSLQFTQFFNTVRCFPNRGCLLTGLYPHHPTSDIWHVIMEHMAIALIYLEMP